MRHIPAYVFFKERFLSFHIKIAIIYSIHEIFGIIVHGSGDLFFIVNIYVSGRNIILKIVSIKEQRHVKNGALIHDTAVVADDIIRNEEKINAKDMVKQLIIGIVIIFVVAMGAPLLINGLSAWVGA